MWFGSKMCSSDVSLDGKCVVITGASSGIGKETARDLLNRGARVILACRDMDKTQNAIQEISGGKSEKLERLASYKLDLGSLNSIKKFASDILESEPRIDTLINNAGVFLCPKSTTEDGFELHFGVNHLGHFLLTNLLLPRLMEAAPSRIVNVSSVLHSRGRIVFDDLMFGSRNYNSLEAYSNSKLANILFTKELSKRLNRTGVTVYAVHPGVAKTELWRYSHQTVPAIIPWLVRTIGGFLMMTPAQGAQTTIYCSVAQELKDSTGLYYSNCKQEEPSDQAKDEEVAKKLWNVSCQLVGLDNSGDTIPTRS